MSAEPRSIIVLVFAMLAASGCTLAGTAIGAEIPRYERVEWQREGIPLGTEVRVRLRRVGTDAFAADEIRGRYGGIQDGLFSVTDDRGREHELAVGDLRDLEVRRGTEWKKGLVLGAAADAIVVVAAVAIANGANVSIATQR
jgi:hypothetical protein